MADAPNTTKFAPRFDQAARNAELAERARIVAWLRARVADHRDHGEHAVDPLRSDQLTVAWIIECYATETAESAHE